MRVAAPPSHPVVGALRQSFRALVVTGGLVALLASAAGVAAAPANSKWETFELVCGEATFLVTASPGGWSVAHVVTGGPGSHLVPFTVDLTVTNLDTSEVLVDFDYEKPGRRGHPAIECVDQHERIDPDTGETIAIDFRSFVFIPR